MALQAIRRQLTAAVRKDSEPEATPANDKVAAPKPSKLKETYTIRDVIKQNYRTLVNDQIPCKPTDKDYIGCFQRAVTTVLRNMDEDDLETAQTILAKWNQEGAPVKVKSK